MNRPLTLAYSPCPNDTFGFYALAHGELPIEGISLEISLSDVESLNQAARDERYDVTKLSFAALGYLLSTYGLLRSGAALGRGCGPLIVARSGFRPAALGNTPIATPGLWTTASMLLALYMERVPLTEAMPFDRIMPSVARGAFEVGVIIHEGRFTFRDYGLECIVDLGEWWEDVTGLPIPLGCIAIRRALGQETARKMETIIRHSVQFAWRYPDVPGMYVRQHAQEMAPEVIRQHIDLYVNDFTLDLGEEGREAIVTLFEQAAKHCILPSLDQPIFAC